VAIKFTRLYPDAIATWSKEAVLRRLTKYAATPGLEYMDYMEGELIYHECIGLGTAQGRDIVIADALYQEPVTAVDERAFEGKDWLSSVIIPDRVTTIRAKAFNNCSGLTSVTIPSSVTNIGSYAFFGCSSLNSVHITDIGAWLNVEFTDAYSHPFHYLSAIDRSGNLYLNGEPVTALVIPDSVTSIGNYAFCGCGLTSVTIPNSVTRIGKDVFRGCTSLQRVVIPDSVTYLGGGAFAQCSNLVQVTMPSNLSVLKYSLFAHCTKLSSITIPAKVKYIEYNVFYNCTELRTIQFLGSTAQWNAIPKDQKWNYNIKATTVTCSDGTVAL